VLQQGRWKSDAWKLYHRPNANSIRIWGQWAVPPPMLVIPPGYLLTF
jgi:hypothetical protein